MSMLNLGGKGIFISDSAREELNLKISEEEFQALKDEMKTKDGKHKCFITGRWFDSTEGAYFSPELMANGIQKQLDTADKVYSEFKSGVMGCLDCGKKFEFDTRYMKCPYCEAKIDAKKYEKKIKLPAARKTAFKLYIRYLRKEVKK